MMFSGLTIFLIKSKWFLLFVLVLTLAFWTGNRFEIGQSNAQTSNAVIKITPERADLKLGDERFVVVSLRSTSPVSGFDLYLKSTGGLEILDVFDQPVVGNKTLNSNFRKVIEDISAKNARISYVFPDKNEPASFDLLVKIKAVSAGQGVLLIDTQNSQILISGGDVENPDGGAVNYNLGSTRSSDEFIEPAELPEELIPPSSAVIKMRLRLLGIKSYPAGEIKNLTGTVVAVGRVGEDNFESQISPMTLVPGTDGIFEARAVIPGFRDGTKFSLMIKVNNYLLKRVCDEKPTESNPNEYLCFDPALTIRQGENSFDFSGIYLMPGDLVSPDGILNGYDLSLVRNNLGKSDLDTLKKADLNLDGIVDKKDFDLISYSVLHTRGENDK